MIAGIEKRTPGKIGLICACGETATSRLTLFTLSNTMDFITCPLTNMPVTLVRR